MPMVECRTLYGKSKWIDINRLIQRPSVYGLVARDQQVLLVMTQFTRKYCLPGGAIEKGEGIEAALEREFKEETGIAVQVEDFARFETNFFYYDPLDMAIHGFLFFYYCTPLTFNLLSGDDAAAIEDVDVSHPVWVDIADLSEDSFQTHGALTMQMIRALVQ